jgi:hypothetical protein
MILTGSGRLAIKTAGTHEISNMSLTGNLLEFSLFYLCEAEFLLVPRSYIATSYGLYRDLSLWQWEANHFGYVLVKFILSTRLPQIDSCI